MMNAIEKFNITATEISENEREATLVVEPLVRGYGMTLGNSLRRVLLSTLPGYAATSIKIDGVLHEISACNGVKEDVPEIVLNVKGIVAKLECEGPKTVVIDVVGPCAVTAGDITPDADIAILNPDHHICTVSDGARFYMEITFDEGRGYAPSDVNKQNYLASVGANVGARQTGRGRGHQHATLIRLSDPLVRGAGVGDNGRTGKAKALRRLYG